MQSTKRKYLSITIAVLALIGLLASLLLPAIVTGVTF